jgi:hypothetical protein
MVAHLTARSLKVTIVLDPAEVALLAVPDGQPRCVLRTAVAGRIVTADIAARSLRKAQATIHEHGPAGVAVILQGKLVVGDQLAEAALAAQAKAPKPAPVEQAEPA